jgi:alpha-L-fucosidase
MPKPSLSRRTGCRLGAAAMLLLPIGGILRSAETVPAGLHALSEPDPARDARVEWHKEARFGCFMHWGVYSSVGGVWPGVKSGTYSEHLMRWAKIPRAVYLEQVVKPFDPEKFDADAWVRLLRDTGMRYLVITAKHHDGFAMYPSKVSAYNITLTKFKRDPMRELRDACTRYGIKFGFYYSHAFDWEHPDAPGNDWDYDNPGGDKKLGGEEWWHDPAEDVASPDGNDSSDTDRRASAAKSRSRADFLPRARHYVDEKAIPQIRELITMYHPDILWFDTPHKLPPSENFRILAALRAADPHVVVNGRLVRDYGDYKNTADRPAEIPYTDGHWEGIPTTNESYGWSRVDHSHKPPEHFIVLLAKSVSKGGNMLLNIGPMGDGEIDPADVSILRGIGAWMRVNHESIYECGRTPLAVQNWGTSTLNAKTHALYLHVFHWPANGKLLVGGLKSDPQSARLLASAAAAITWKRVSANDVELAVPATAPDAADTVIRLDFAGKIEADFARYVPGEGSTTLHVMDGALDGKGLRYGDGKRNNDCTLEWRQPGSGVAWPVRLTAPTRFAVALNYATAAKNDGGTFEIAGAEKTLTGTVRPTESATAFATVPVGEIELPAGEFTLTVRAATVSGGSLMKLRTVELTPLP